MKILLTLLSFSLLTSCAPQTKTAGRFKASLNQLPEPELGEVWTAENEKQAEGILHQMLDMIEKSAGENGFVTRDAHPKAHGCVKAFVSLDPSALPADLRVGSFANRTESTPSWIRFSNGSPSGKKASDLEKDVRGMAVKMMGMPGSASGNQDFVMMTSKEFFSKDGDDYAALFEALKSGSALGLAKYAILHPKSALRLSGARIQIAHPMEATYHSSVIYKLGKTSMRFKASPCVAGKSQLPSQASAQFLRERLVETLKTQEGCFNIFVQPNREPDRQPVEDPRVVWNEEKSPYFKVGTIRIPVQTELSQKAAVNMCENLSFDPWHTHPQNRPLGQINRARALVYREISRFRHEKNRTTVIEPRDHNPCVGATAALCDEPRF